MQVFSCSDIACILERHILKLCYRWVSSFNYLHYIHYLWRSRTRHAKWHKNMCGSFFLGLISQDYSVLDRCVKRKISIHINKLNYVCPGSTLFSVAQPLLRCSLNIFLIRNFTFHQESVLVGTSNAIFMAKNKYSESL